MGMCHRIFFINNLHQDPRRHFSNFSILCGHCWCKLLVCFKTLIYCGQLCNNALNYPNTPLSEKKTISWRNFSELLSLCVFHLTWLLLLYTNTWFSVYCFHCILGIATFKPKVIHARFVCSGNRREAAHWRERPGFPRICVGFRQGIERGYRSEKGMSVRMGIIVASSEIVMIYD
jgi:hypothetical protein